MAIGAITKDASAGERGSDPIFVVLMSFAGDGAYPSGGTAAFEASVQAVAGLDGVDVLGVIGQDCGGYVPVYDRPADKLKVYEQTSTATSPLIETATSNLSGTNFELIVLCR
jgi:hypothetical protein